VPPTTSARTAWSWFIQRIVGRTGRNCKRQPALAPCQWLAFPFAGRELRTTPIVTIGAG